jgi:hypothetical protein
MLVNQINADIAQTGGGIGSSAAYTVAAFLTAGQIVSGVAMAFPLGMFGTVDITGQTVCTACTAAHATGMIISYPPGQILIPTGLTMSSGGIVGAGITTLYNLPGTPTGVVPTGLPGSTVLLVNDTTSGNTIQYNANPYLGSFTFKNFSMCMAPGYNKPGGYMLAIGQSGTASSIGQGGVMDSVTFLTNTNSGIAALSSTVNYLSMQNCGTWHISNCDFGAYSGAAITVSNFTSYDDGDSTISECQFDANGTAGVAVLQQSSGGLKLIGCKMNGGASGYQWNQGASVNSAISTTILLISACSMENMSGPNIQFKNTQNNGSSFGKISITGNQLDLAPCMIDFEPITGSPANSAFWFDVVISGNTMNQTAQSSAYNNSMINLNTVSTCMISGNIGNCSNQVNYFAFVASTCITGAGTIGYNNVTQPVTAAVQNNATWTIH